MVATRLQTVVSALVERDVITDTAETYGEPGYNDDGMVLFGSWWCHCPNGPDKEESEQRAAANNREPSYLHALDVHYPRVFAWLEEVANLEWLDEWVTVEVDGQLRAYRTEADSYSWQPTAVFNSDTCEYMVNGHDIGAWLAWCENDYTRCLMRDSFTDDQLAEEGYVERECNFESGWYGQSDNPEAIMTAIRDREPWVNVVFKLDQVEQFRVTFCVYVKGAEEGE